MAASNFWDNKKRSAHVITILNNEKKILSDVKNLLDETKDFLEMAKTIDSNDLNGLNWLENESTQLTLKIDELETWIEEKIAFQYENLNKNKRLNKLEFIEQQENKLI